MKIKNRKSHKNIVWPDNSRKINNRLFVNTVHSLQRQWILSFVAVIAGIVLLTNASAWASPVLAPANQTVPIPTATPTPTPVPTVTPAPTATPEDDADEPIVDPTEEPIDLDEDDGSFFEDTEEESLVDEESTEDNDSSEDSDSNENESSSEPTGSSSQESSSSEPATGIEADNTVASTGITASVAVIVLNIREQPSLESAVVGTVFQDDSLEVLGRNGDWWLVCCAIGSDEPAWVNPDFLEPGFDLAQADALLPEFGSENNAAGETSSGSVQAKESSPDLELKMSLNPRYIWQNLTFDLEFVVRNVGNSAVTNIVLRDELLGELEFITAKVSDDGQVIKESLDNGNSLVTVSWPNLAANTEVNVAFTLRAVGELENGYVIDNLSVVGAAETSSTTAGISIGLPPSELPIFK